MAMHVSGRGPGHLVRQAGGTGSIQLPEGLAATNCRGLNTSNTTNKQIMSRTAHVAKDAISSLKIAVMNARLPENGSAPEAYLGGTITLTAAVEYNGVFTQITFDGGATSKVVANGGVAVSDYTAGDLGIPNGATFFVRMFKTSATGILYNPWRNSANGDLTTVAASGLSDQTLGGTIASSGNYSAPPLAIIARTTYKAPLVFGDSKTHGYLDTAESATAAGPGLRGEICKSFAASQAFVNIATGGLKALDWDTAGYCEGRKLLLPYFSHLFLSLGHNDIMVAGSSAAQAQADLENIVADYLAARPDGKVTIATQGHKSTSAGGQWINDADQTPVGQTARLALNAAIRAGGVAGQNNGFFEVSRQLESVADNGIWKNDGVTNKLYTSDGVHETPAGYSLIVTAAAVDYAAKLAA